MKKQIVLGLTAAFLLVSCKMKKEKKTDEKAVTEMNLERKINLNQIQGNYVITSFEAMPEINGVAPTVFIDETGRIGGNNGCNSYFGQINLEDEKLMSNLGSTRRACPGEASDIERMMMESMQEVDNITVEGKVIRFYKENNAVIIGKSISLEQGTWQVISIVGKEYSVMPNFSVENSRLTGNTGCNSFFGMVQQKGLSLKIAEPGMTEMECPDFNTNMESTFIGLLAEVTDIRMNGSIAIFMNNGEELFRAENPEQE
ncbi:MAG: META domain-containing protein [Flavobacteriales bacterium]